VSGPWTSFVAALDKGQCRKAVCRRHIDKITVEIKVARYQAQKNYRQYKNIGFDKITVEIKVARYQA
jgi:hypothetical protein